MAPLIGIFVVVVLLQPVPRIGLRPEDEAVDKPDDSPKIEVLDIESKSFTEEQKNQLKEGFTSSSIQKMLDLLEHEFSNCEKATSTCMEVAFPDHEKNDSISTLAWDYLVAREGWGASDKKESEKEEHCLARKKASNCFHEIIKRGREAMKSKATEAKTTLTAEYAVDALHLKSSILGFAHIDPTSGQSGDSINVDRLIGARHYLVMLSSIAEAKRDDWEGCKDVFKGEEGKGGGEGADEGAEKSVATSAHLLPSLLGVVCTIGAFMSLNW